MSADLFEVESSDTCKVSKRLYPAHGCGCSDSGDWELSPLSVPAWEEEPPCSILRKSLLRECDVERVATSLRCMDCAEGMELSGTDGDTGRRQSS
jgi:hypothetical protein